MLAVPAPGLFHSPGLSRLSAAQQSLVEFLEIDIDLVAGAASGDVDLKESGRDVERDMEQWIAAVHPVQAPEIFKHLLQGRSQEAERLLKTRFAAWQRSQRADKPAATACRSFADLVALAESAREIRKQKEAKEQARMQAKRRKERERYLTMLAVDFGQYWAAAHEMAERGTASAYDQVKRTIADLAEAYSLKASRDAFERALEQFMAKHGRRGALVRRLAGAKLWK